MTSYRNSEPETKWIPADGQLQQTNEILIRADSGRIVLVKPHYPVVISMRFPRDGEGRKLYVNVNPAFDKSEKLEDYTFLLCDPQGKTLCQLDASFFKTKRDKIRLSNDRTQEQLFGKQESAE